MHSQKKKRESFLKGEQRIYKITLTLHQSQLAIDQSGCMHLLMLISQQNVPHRHSLWNLPGEWLQVEAERPAALALL